MKFSLQITTIIIFVISSTACVNREKKGTNNSSNDEIYQIREVIPCKYDAVYSFSGGVARVKINNKWGLIDRNGKQITGCKYDKIDSFSNGLARVEMNDKWGFINKEGDEIIPCQYGFCYNFSEGLALVSISFMENTTLEDAFYGKVFIDENSNKILKLKYITAEISDFRGFKEGLAALSLTSRNHKWGFIDKAGREITPFIYDAVVDFSEDMACVSKNGKWGFIDRRGNLVIDCKYDKVYSFSHGFARVYKDNKLLLIDKLGNEVTPLNYDELGEISEGLMAVSRNGQWGFIDENHNIIIDFKYELAYKFSEGLAFVRKSGLWGFVDKSGNEVISCQYTDAKSFYNGFASAYRGNKSLLIDKSGNELAISEYEDSFSEINEGLLAVSKNGKWGFVSVTGTKSEILHKKVDYDWLIGTWEVHTPIYGKLSLVILDEKNLIINDGRYGSQKGTYRIDESILTYYDKTDVGTQAIIIESNKTLEFGDGYYYRKTSGSYTSPLLSTFSQYEEVITSLSENTDVRKDPSNSSQVLYRIPINQNVFINKVPTGEWFQVISYGNNTTGWIHKSQINILPSDSSYEQEIVGGQEAIINDEDGYTNVRSSPNTSSEILYKIYDNETFYVDPVLNENWYKVIASENRPSGWIHKSRVKILSLNPNEKMNDELYERSTIEIETNDKPLQKAETMPQFKGGETEMQRFIAENLKYPVIAQENRIQGRVSVRFIVTETGNITDVTIVKGVDPSCDREAVRVVKAMPKWIPGKQKGQNVSVYFTLPITFKLKQ